MSHHAFRPLFALVAACGAAIIASTGHAADSEGRFAIRGPGSQSCAQYLAAQAHPEDYARFGSWLLGYASARNRFEQGVYDHLPTEGGTDFPNIVAVLCKTDGARMLEQAAHSALTALAPMRQTAASPLVEVRADGKAVSIRQDALRTLQTALIAKKAFKGRADGQPSAALVTALKDFQRKEGIAQTGLPDIDSFVRAIIKR